MWLFRRLLFARQSRKLTKRGDVAELPEREHAAGAAFEGPPAGMDKLWQTCLALPVTITTKGEA